MRLTVNGKLMKLLRQRATLILLLWLVFFLSIYNLGGYPSAWFDEGLNFQPPKNLVQYGKYAMLSSEGFRVLDPALQTGPPVTLPVALSFKLLGIGLFQARLVSSVFTVLCVATYYRVAQTLYGREVSWLAVILLLVFAANEEFVSLFFVGRQLLGEVPALFFFLSGLLLWFRSWEQAEIELLVGAGLLFGLAMTTKSQFSLLVPPTVLTVWLLGILLFGGTLGLRHLVLPSTFCAVLVLTWYGCQMAIVGPRQFSLNVETLRTGMRLHVLNFSLTTVRHSLGVLARTGYIVWGGLALPYAIWHSRTRDVTTLKKLALLVFVSLWLGWYTIASIGWARYAFVAVALSHMFYAALLRDSLVTLLEPTWCGTRQQSKLRLILAVAPLLLAGWMVTSGTATIGPILRSQDAAYHQFARYLNDTIPPCAVVESWEWELDLITDLRYHHPPTSVTNSVTRRLWVEGSESQIDYDFQQFEPSYVIVGRFARWTGIYPTDFLKQSCSLVFSVGEYDLYRVNVRADDQLRNRCRSAQSSSVRPGDR